MERNCLTSTIRYNTENYFLSLKDVSEKNKFIDKGLISIHRSNKGYSSTFNIMPISSHLHATYHFVSIYHLQRCVIATKLFLLIFQG